MDVVRIELIILLRTSLFALKQGNKRRDDLVAQLRDGAGVKRARTYKERERAGLRRPVSKLEVDRSWAKMAAGSILTAEAGNQPPKRERGVRVISLPS